MKGRSDGTLIFHPRHHQNVFASPEWRNYAYQQDRLTDPELQSLKPVGQENLIHDSFKISDGNEVD